MAADAPDSPHLVFDELAAASRTWIHECYVEELLRGQCRDETRRRFLSLAEEMRERSAIDGVILAGTELPLLLAAPRVADLPALHTTGLHVEAIVARLARY